MSETAQPVRRLSGVGFGVSRLSQRVSTVLKPGGSGPANGTVQQTQPAVKPAVAIQQAGPTVAPSASNGIHPPASEKIVDQLRFYEKEGFIPPRSCCGFKRVSIGRISVSGPAVTFCIIVFHSTTFEVTVENGATSAALDGCVVRVHDVEKLNSRGRSLANAQTGVINHPAFKAGNSLGGWLPHYAIGVLIYLLLRLLDDDGVETEIANAAIGPFGFDLIMPTGLALMKGKRGTMEDYKMVYPPQKGVALFGVFDGHGGYTAAEYASRNIPLVFHANFASPLSPQDHHARALAIRRSLQATLEEVDRKFLTETKETSGSTVCVAAVDLENLVVHVANVGDTRCVLCREGRAMDLSIDHKANHPAEIARIMDSGGFVARGRALGLLAISRALGDRDLKRSAPELSPITAVPDCDSFVMDPSRDEFILLACDGLFDVMSSQQVVTFVRARIAEGMNEEAAAVALANHAIETLGSLDNVTVILIGLNWNYVGVVGSANSTPRSMRAPTIRRSESATLRAAKASAHKRQTSRMSSTESSSTPGASLLLGGT